MGGEWIPAGRKKADGMERHLTIFYLSGGRLFHARTGQRTVKGEKIGAGEWFLSGKQGVGEPGQGIGVGVVATITGTSDPVPRH